MNTQEQLVKYTLIKKWESEANDIIHAVCFHLGVSVAAAKSKTRVQSVVDARQLSCYIMRKRFNKETTDSDGRKHVTKMTLESIGSYFGIDHATVGHAIKTVKNLPETDKQYKTLAETLFYELIPNYNETN
jgi:chromosomal replication initiator protein